MNGSNPIRNEDYWLRIGAKLKGIPMVKDSAIGTLTSDQTHKLQLNRQNIRRSQKWPSKVARIRDLKRIRMQQGGAR